jgi:hypothetical protein
MQAAPNAPVDSAVGVRQSRPMMDAAEPTGSGCDASPWRSVGISGLIWESWHYPITAIVYRDAGLMRGVWRRR